MCFQTAEEDALAKIPSPVGLFESHADSVRRGCRLPQFLRSCLWLRHLVFFVQYTTETNLRTGAVTALQPVGRVLLIGEDSSTRRSARANGFVLRVLGIAPPGPGFVLRVLGRTAWVRFADSGLRRGMVGFVLPILDPTTHGSGVGSSDLEDINAGLMIPSKQAVVSHNVTMAEWTQRDSAGAVPDWGHRSRPTALAGDIRRPNNEGSFHSRRFNWEKTGKRRGRNGRDY